MTCIAAAPIVVRTAMRSRAPLLPHWVTSTLVCHGSSSAKEGSASILGGWGCGCKPLKCGIFRWDQHLAMQLELLRRCLLYTSDAADELT